MTTCKTCGTTVDDLAVFPGKRCLDCYAKATANDPLVKPDFAGAIDWKRFEELFPKV